MYALYSLLLTLGFLILLPRFLFDALRHGKYVAGFRERLGYLTPTEKRDGPVLWLHCVSVGETQAARPLVRRIRQEFPQYSLVVSTITLTGQNLAREVFREDATRVIYFPFDWRWTVRRALKAIRPTAILVMETELWPNFFRECHKQQIPVTLVNGRISARSFRRYRLIRSFLKGIFPSMRLAIMQTDEDAERINNLGYPSEKLFVAGSLKFDVGTISSSISLTEEFRRRFNIRSEVPLILAASTHAPEEWLLLESFRQAIVRLNPKPRLMIAPRHPERFGEVGSLLKASGFSWTRSTAPETETDQHCDMILLDTIGELPAVYPLASVVFVGGSIANRGGHNILEPAAVGRCIITGAHTHNFEAIVRVFAQAQALVQLASMTDRQAVTELASVLTELLNNESQRTTLGRRALALVEQNRGATERTVKLIRPLLSLRPISETQVDSFSVQRAHAP